MSDTGVAITLELSVKPELVDIFCEQLKDMVEVTKTFPGFRDIEMVRQAEDPSKILFFEHWDSAEAYQAYIAFRTERGEMEQLSQLVTEPPIIRMWPTPIVRVSA